MKYKVEGYLKKRCYKVVEANSPEEAIKKALGSKPAFRVDKSIIFGSRIEVIRVTEIEDDWKNEPTVADLRRDLVKGTPRESGVASIQRIVREIIKMHLHLSKPNLRRTVFACLRSLHNSLSPFAKNNPSSICESADSELKALYRDFRESSLRKWLPDFTPKEPPIVSVRKIIQDIFYLFSDVKSGFERKELIAAVLKAIHSFFLETQYKEQRVSAELERQIKALA